MKRQNNNYRLKAVKNEEGLRILKQAEYYFNSFQPVRDMITRNRNYAYGRQLEDLVPDGEGHMVKEKDLIIKQGGSTLTQNMLRHQINVLVGSYLNMNSEAITKARDRSEQTYAECLTELLKYVNDINYAQSFYARVFEEYVVGAASVVRKSYQDRPDALDVQDCITTNVNIKNFFCDTDMEDFRGWDGNMVGQIHDVQWDDLRGTFCRSQRDEDVLKGIYGKAMSDFDNIVGYNNFGKEKYHGDFLHTGDPSKCRVIEVWKKQLKYRKRYIDNHTGEVFIVDPADVTELVDNVNSQRYEEFSAAGVDPAEIEEHLIEYVEDFGHRYWHFYFFAPDGSILIEGDTPYYHGSHPYVFSFYPFIGGELHAFIEDAIDIQKNLNQMMRLNQYLLQTGAKNLLLVPKSALGNTRLEDLEHTWSSPAGVFVWEDKNGQNTNMPQQVNTAATNVSVSQLINLERQFLQDVTGVTDALQGKSVGSVSGSYYAQQAANAAVGIQSLITAFSAFMKMNAAKDCYNIQQYYSEERIVEILGREKADLYKAKRVKDLMFDINISESQSSPIYRQLANEWLMGLFQAGQISLKTLVEAGDFPYGDKVLQLTQEEQRQAQEAQMQQAPMDPTAMPTGEGSTAGLEEVDTTHEAGATAVPSTLTNPINPVTREEQGAAVK